MIKNLDIKDINKFKIFLNCDFHISSFMYKDKGLIHKLPFLYDKEKGLDKELIDVINYLDTNEIKGIIKVNNFITENDNIIGYSMKRYKDYKSLNKNKHRKLALKVEDCLQIMKVIENLNNNKLIYRDFHTGNVLLNKTTNDIKICDIDAMYIDKKNEDPKWQTRKALGLCVSYIYNVHPDYGDIVVSRNYPIDRYGYFEECIKYANTKDFDESIKLLRKLDNDSIKEDRIKIKKHANEYMNSGYYKLL